MYLTRGAFQTCGEEEFRGGDGVPRARAADRHGTTREILQRGNCRVRANQHMLDLRLHHRKAADFLESLRKFRAVSLLFVVQQARGHKGDIRVAVFEVLENGRPVLGRDGRQDDIRLRLGAGFGKRLPSQRQRPDSDLILRLRRRHERLL
jgi:hypothetical protein